MLIHHKAACHCARNIRIKAGIALGALFCMLSRPAPLMAQAASPARQIGSATLSYQLSVRDQDFEYLFTTFFNSEPRYDDGAVQQAIKKVINSQAQQARMAAAEFLASKNTTESALLKLAKKAIDAQSDRITRERIATIPALIEEAQNKIALQKQAEIYVYGAYELNDTTLGPQWTRLQSPVSKWQKFSIDVGKDASMPVTLTPLGSAAILDVKISRSIRMNFDFQAWRPGVSESGELKTRCWAIPVITIQSSLRRDDRSACVFVELSNLDYVIHRPRIEGDFQPEARAQ